MTPGWLDLAGRVALVTGAGSPTGIGFATARALADLGAATAISSTTGRIEERGAELRASGADVSVHVADLTDDAAGAQLVHQVLARFGRIDILVNNAGMVSLGSSTESGSAEQMPIQTWRAGIQRNLDTSFIAARHVLPGMRERGWGRIVNVASVTGPVMAMRSEPAYAAAKAGMVGLTRALALDAAAAGITVNAVAPGWIATGSQTEAERREGDRTPVGRSASPAEVAAVIAWLCTPGASYLTGQCVVVDGGNSIAEQRSAE